jgi:hypothetical protein
MDTQTGDIGGWKELFEKATTAGRETRHIVQLDKLPDKNCPDCQGTGKGPRDPETLLWTPCHCTKVPAGSEPCHSATFNRLNGKC